MSEQGTTKKLLPIRKEGDPILRQVATPVEHGADRRELIGAMFATLDCMRALGLAAPQIGVSERVLVVDVKGRRHAVINPEVVRIGQHKDWAREGCLSIPNRQVGVRRPTRVSITGFDECWAPVTIDATYLLARCLQHEIDHLNGRLMIDGEAA